MENIFAGFNTADSYAILFIIFIAFLFGLVVGLLLRGRVVRQLKKELKAANEQVAAANAEVAGIRDQLPLKEADLRKCELEKADMVDRANHFEEEKTRLYSEVYNLNATIEKWQAAHREQTATIEELQRQLSALQSQNTQLNEEIAREEENVNDLASMQSLYNAARLRMESIEEKINRLEGENQTLRLELDAMKVAPVAVAPVATTPGPVLDFAIEADAEPEYQPVTDKNVLGDRIVTDPIEKDDLTLIVGVGPFLEKKLNDAGILTFEQMSHWDDAEVDRITQLIGYFPGRIAKDNWVGQAQQLLQTKKDHPWALQPLGMGGGDVNDLKIIEGIGPKIEQLLKEAGINSWYELADSSIERLHDILAAAGDAYRIHDPGTWPDQARMAANGQWALLKEYQEELKGGRPPKL